MLSFSQGIDGSEWIYDGSKWTCDLGLVGARPIPVPTWLSVEELIASTKVKALSDAIQGSAEEIFPCDVPKNEPFKYNEMVYFVRDINFSSYASAERERDILQSTNSVAYRDYFYLSGLAYVPRNHCARVLRVDGIWVQTEFDFGSKLARLWVRKELLSRPQVITGRIA